MTPVELLDALFQRGVEVSAKGDRLRVSPASGLTDAERELLREHARDLVALLRAPRPKEKLVVELTVDAVLRAEEEERARTFAPPRTLVMFRTSRGVVPLHALRVDEVRRLEARGKLSSNEVNEWARQRRGGL